jgi:hypothetical protein
MGKGSTTTQTTSLPSWENSDLQSLLSQTNSQVNNDLQAVNYGQVQNQIGNSTQGILNQQVNPTQLSSGISAAGSSNWTNPGTASSYMSPYESTALANQVQLANSTLLQPELASIDQGAAASGALGGDRDQVLKSQAINNFNQSEQNQIAQGENTAYTTGQSAYESDAARNLAGQEAAANTGIAGSQANVNTNLAATQNQLSGISASEAPEQQLLNEEQGLDSSPNQSTVKGTTQESTGSMLGGILGGLVSAGGDILSAGTNSIAGNMLGIGHAAGGLIGGDGGIGDGLPSKTKKTRRSKKKKAKK